MVRDGTCGCDASGGQSKESRVTIADYKQGKRASKELDCNGTHSVVLCVLSRDCTERVEGA